MIIEFGLTLNKNNYDFYIEKLMRDKKLVIGIILFASIISAIVYLL